MAPNQAHKPVVKRLPAWSHFPLIVLGSLLLLYPVLGRTWARMKTLSAH